MSTAAPAPKRLEGRLRRSAPGGEYALCIDRQTDTFAPTSEKNLCAVVRRDWPTGLARLDVSPRELGGPNVDRASLAGFLADHHAASAEEEEATVRR